MWPSRTRLAWRTKRLIVFDVGYSGQGRSSRCHRGFEVQDGLRWRAMRGELDFAESLQRRVATLAER